MVTKYGSEDSHCDSIWKKFEARAVKLKSESESLREISESEKERIFKARAKKISRSQIRPGDDKDTVKIVSFIIAGELYGIEVGCLDEIYEVNKITKIPCTPPVLSGLINFRGTIITVVNLIELFNLQGKSSYLSNEASMKRKPGQSQKILVLNHANHKAGIKVENLHGLLELPSERILPVSSLFFEKNRIIKSEIYLKGSPLLLIDTQALLNDERLIIEEDV